MIREGSIKLPFAFAVGEAASKVLEAIEERQEILGSHCFACDEVFAPARSFCPGCGTSDLTTRLVGPGGTLRAWTDVPGRGVFGLILLDGASRPWVHNLIGDRNQFGVGVRVEARFSPIQGDPSKAALVGFEHMEAAQ